MSKSRGNVVGPDAYVKEPTARTYCAAPCSLPARGKQAVTSTTTPSPASSDFSPNMETVNASGRSGAGTEPHVERAIISVSDAIERLSFNVALARLMELAAWPTPTGQEGLGAVAGPVRPPFRRGALAKAGQSFSVHTWPWPVPDKAVLETEDVEIVVQVNGRVRGQLRVGRGTDDAEVVAAATNTVGVERPAHVVYVPARLVNLVI